MASEHTRPSFLGLGHELGRIAPGYRANLVLMDGEFRAQRTWIEGIPSRSQLCRGATAARSFQRELRLLPALLAGTFLPSRRASDKPMAMACFLLFTFVPERPLFNVPRLRSCIALSTFLEAASLYFLAAMTSLGLKFG